MWELHVAEIFHDSTPVSSDKSLGITVRVVVCVDILGGAIWIKNLVPLWRKYNRSFISEVNIMGDLSLIHI